METKISAKRVENLRTTLGMAGCYAVESDGLSGGLGLFWSAEYDVDVKSYSSGHIDATVQKKDHSVGGWMFTGFYGASRAENTHQIWRFLRTLSNVNCSTWLYLGDFSETMYASEHFSRAARPEWQMRNFRDVVADCGLQDLGWSRTA
jgi:hypothetical protein